jgi:nicotinate phosphoribosyltransferase
MRSPWVNDANAALLSDLYEFTMLQSYFDEGMDGLSVFDLFMRRLPPNRNYLIACGLEHVLHYLRTICRTAF